MLGDTGGKDNWGQNITCTQCKAGESLYGLKISKTAMKVFDLSEPRLYIKINLEMYKTDYTDENKVNTRLFP